MFTPQRHHVTEDARRQALDGRYAQAMGLDGMLVYFAACGCPCRPPDAATRDLPWCPACERARALQW